ncbi:MAG: NifU family protein [Methanosarcinales archaeon]|nr:NifU family protein [Methanosarcinales archaeon]
MIQESIRPVLKADGGDITLIDFSDGFVKIALEKTYVPVTFSNFLVTFKVRTGCSLVPYYLRLRDLVHKPYRVLNSVRSLNLVVQGMRNSLR